MHHFHAELGESPIDQRELLGRGIPNRDVAAGNRTERQEGGDFMEIFAKAEFAATEGSEKPPQVKF